MARLLPLLLVLAVLAAGGCSTEHNAEPTDADSNPAADAAQALDAGSLTDAGPQAPQDASVARDAQVPVGSDVGPSAADASIAPDAACTGPANCAAADEQRTAGKLDAIVGDPLLLSSFLRDVPKGGDLHQHLSGAVYAETYLDWASTDGDCIVSSSLSLSSTCGSGTVPIPGNDEALYEQIVDAWSMQDFQPAARSPATTTSSPPSGSSAPSPARPTTR